MKNTYKMVMKITSIKTGKLLELVYKLDDSNRAPQPIVKGWQAAGYIVNSFNFVEVNWYA